MATRHPGELIDAVLSSRFGDDWVSVTMANRIGVTVAEFNDVVFHFAPLTEPVADKFTTFLKLEPGLLMRLQQEYA